MESEGVKLYEGKNVKLVFNNDFNLIGKILKLYSDSLSFQTRQKTSLISLDSIKLIMEV
jgi:hypothetical protein